MRFFWDILLPMSRTTIAALFVIQFIYGWNQYLWPLLVTTHGRLLHGGDGGGSPGALQSMRRRAGI